jgi:hypothetical protein
MPQSRRCVTAVAATSSWTGLYLLFTWSLEQQLQVSAMAAMAAGGPQGPAFPE